MLKEAETEETIGFYAKLLSLQAFQFNRARAPCFPSGYAYGAKTPTSSQTHCKLIVLTANAFLGSALFVISNFDTSKKVVKPPQKLLF